MLDAHVAWAWVVVISNAVVGLWALGAHWLPALRVRQLWWAVVAAEVSIAVQVVLGVVAYAGQGIDAPEFHIFYGFIALVSVAILYSYRNQLRARLYLLYGFGSLFLMGLAIRAMLLG
ncbi:MAG: hypothetical protein R2716_06290 [Microthrixaceae bacterium]